MPRHGRARPAQKQVSTAARHLAVGSNAGGLRVSREPRWQGDRGRERPLSPPKLARVEVVVQPLLAQQLLAGAALDDLPFVDHQDLVGIAHRAQPVVRSAGTQART